MWILHIGDHRSIPFILYCSFIIRCFDLAKLACEYADRIPEYREEYEEIAQKCRNLSVELLDQCNDTGEVQLVLQESTGANKYFRHSRNMKYPRLRLAIEHNHKEFVGKNEQRGLTVTKL